MIFGGTLNYMDSPIKSGNDKKMKNGRYPKVFTCQYR